jgi:hypothetical protein
MLLSIEDTHTSVDVGMLGTEESDEERIQSFPVVTMADENENTEHSSLALRTFMDVDPAVTSDEEMQTVTRSLPKGQCLEKVPKVVKTYKARGFLQKIHC